ncbi:MAG: hypothetical protein IK990_09190 [Ruminiclostridium sp.]|nr:hypothetical protein [Ruminiclostridium sp.]
MKKRTIAGTALFLTAALLGSCSDPSAVRTDALIDSIVNDAASQAGPAVTEPPKPAAVTTSGTTELTLSAGFGDLAAAEGSAADEGYTDEVINVDLTAMNPTMIYSVIYDIMVNPGNYYGKRVLLDGYFDTSYDERLDTRYYFIVVPDATACCSQGLEFILNRETVYPGDYPEPGTDIRINGVIDHYDEEGKTYCYIKADSLSLI